MAQATSGDDGVHPGLELRRRARVHEFLELFIEECPPVRVASVEADAAALQQPDALLDDAANRCGIELRGVWIHDRSLDSDRNRMRDVQAMTVDSDGSTAYRPSLDPAVFEAHVATR